MIGRRRSQLAPLLGGAGLHHDGMDLGQAPDVQGPRTEKKVPLWSSTCILASSKN